MPPLVPNSPEESATTAKRSQRNSPDARCPLWGGVSPRWRGTTARLVFVASPTVIPRTSEELPGGNDTKGNILVMISKGPLFVGAELLFDYGDVREDDLVDRDGKHEEGLRG